MDYKEKYEHGLECIQEILCGAGDSIKTSILRKRLQPFFPELEDEDERIRKELTEDYCSQEVLQLLREKGFPVGVGSWSRGFVWDGEGYAPGLVKHENSITHQMALKWLRDVYDIHISVNKTFLINDMDNKPYLVYVCTEKCNTSYNAWSEYHSTYEQAVEAALKYCLTELI